MKELILETTDGQEVTKLEEENKTLAEYKIEETTKWKLKARSQEAEQNKTRYIFNKTEEVKKYEISEEDYNKREDTFRKYKEKFIDPQRVKPSFILTNDKNVSVGDRCLVIKTGTRGVVMFVGNTQFAPGVWIGGFFFFHIYSLIYFSFLNLFYLIFLIFFFF